MEILTVALEEILGRRGEEVVGCVEVARTLDEKFCVGERRVGKRRGEHASGFMGRNVISAVTCTSRIYVKVTGDAVQIMNWHPRS